MPFWTKKHNPYSDEQPSERSADFISSEASARAFLNWVNEGRRAQGLPTYTYEEMLEDDTLPPEYDLRGASGC